MQKHILGCWKRDFDKILLTYCTTMWLIWIYGWTWWATCCQPAQFRGVWSSPLKRTRVDSSGSLPSQTANLVAVRFGPGPGPDVTVRIRCQHYLQLPPLLPGCPSSAWGLSHSPSVTPSSIATCTPEQSANQWKKVPTTWLLVCGLLNAVSRCIWISGILPPPAGHATSLAIDSGTFLVHSWWSTQSTAISCAAHEVCRANSRGYWWSASGFLVWNQHNLETKE